ncbi:hypothetical protein QUF64_13165 [Anaerolineales bacterium HSG6]|nr:hypothetical protein [Anaerolineales bacterium HSG6]MDM8531052.1 hypothetical protein [Anaerolineales bacterium HSG25]
MSKKMFRIFMIMAILAFVAALPVAAQDGGAVDEGDGLDNPVEESAADDSADAADDGAVVEDEGEGQTDAVEESAAVDDVDAVDGGAVEGQADAVEETIDALGNEDTEAVAATDVVNPSGSLNGTFTTNVIAIANLAESGSASSPALQLYNISDGAEASNIASSVYPSGVAFVDSSELSEGEFSGVLSSDFAAAVATLIVNNESKVADAYTGFGDAAINTDLVGTLIFNKHADFESVFYCQNAGSNAATITANLFKAGESSAKVTLISSPLEPGRAVKWDIADDNTVQTTWPGKTGEYGYATFSSAEKIACVVDNQRMVADYVQSLFSAVPTAGFSDTDLRIPLTFNSHGQSSANEKGIKWITGISIVNTNDTDATAKVTFTSATNWTHECSATVPANSSIAWEPNKAGVKGVFADCGSAGAIPWPNVTGINYSYGSVVIESSQPVLALANSNRYDSGAGLGAGYSSQGASPASATQKAACPIAYNKTPGTDWTTGIQAANVGSAATDISFTMVKANADPAGAGNSVTLTPAGSNSFSGVAAGGSATAQLFNGPTAAAPSVGNAIADFEGLVLVSSSASNIAVSSSNTNYDGIGAGAMYDCINY